MISLLASDDALRARAVVDQIAGALVDPHAHHWRPMRHLPTPSNLARGKAGIALFLAHAARFLRRAELGQAGRSYLNEAIDAGGRVPTFAGGVFGVAWAAEQLVHAGVEGDRGEINDEVDGLLDARLSLCDETDDFDLFNGWVGRGVYALARRARPQGTERLAAVVDRLRVLAQPCSRGVTWFRSPAMLGEDGVRLFPRGHYNLGTSHGHAGVVGFLADVVASGAALPQAGPLLDDAVLGLLAHRRDCAGRSFPALMDHEGRVLAASPGAWLYGDTGLESWSYGDLSRALVLLAAGRVRGRADWEEEALDIARVAARRASLPAAVPWAGLSHGRAGTAYLLARLSRGFRDRELAALAARWYRRCWDLVEQQGGAKAYLAPARDEHDVRGPGFFEGLAGIGLATLAAIPPGVSGWDAALAVGSSALTRSEN